MYLLRTVVGILIGYLLISYQEGLLNLQGPVRWFAEFSSDAGKRLGFKKVYLSRAIALES